MWDGGKGKEEEKEDILCIKIILYKLFFNPCFFLLYKTACSDVYIYNKIYTSRY